MKHHLLAFRLVVIASLITAVVLSTLLYTAAAGPFQHEATKPSAWTRDAVSGVYVYYANIGEIECRPATGEEALALEARDPLTTLSVIPRRNRGLLLHANGNLNIVLRGTDQLNNFPQARDAFLMAADL